MQQHKFSNKTVKKSTNDLIDRENTPTPTKTSFTVTLNKILNYVGRKLNASDMSNYK